MIGADVRNPEEGSLENRIAVMADQAITAWRARGLEGMVPGPGGGDFPAALAINILSLEFLLHAWDFAQASGQELTVSDELAAYVLGLAEQVVPGARQGGAFAPEQPVSDDAVADGPPGGLHGPPSAGHRLSRVSCGTRGSPSRSGCRRSTRSAGSRSPGPRPRPSASGPGAAGSTS